MQVELIIMSFTLTQRHIQIHVPKHYDEALRRIAATIGVLILLLCLVVVFAGTIKLIKSR